MSKIIPPEVKSYPGPWILDNASLSELDVSIQKIFEEMKMNVAATEKKGNEDTYGLDFFDPRFYDVIDLHGLSSYGADRECVVSLKLEDGSYVVGSKINEVVAKSIVNDKKTEKLQISITINKKKFAIRIGNLKGIYSTDHEDELLVKIVGVPPDIHDKIVFIIETWIDKHTPKPIEAMWSKLFAFPSPMLALVIVIVGLAAYLVSVLKAIISYYDKINTILENGLQQNELIPVVKSLIDIQTNQFYLPDVSNSTNVRLLVLVLLVLIWIILLKCFRPRTIIGIGKNKKKMNQLRVMYKVICTWPASFIMPFIHKIFGL